MPTYDDVAIAARLGLLAGSADPAGARREALGLVVSALGGDAGSVVDLATSRVVVDQGYDAPVSQALAREFPETPWMAMVADAWLPMSLSTEPERSYRDGWFFRERVEPSGFRDGVTGRLTTGRVGASASTFGLIHVSSCSAARFDADRCAALAGMLPALSVLLAAPVAYADPSPASGRLLEVGRQVPPGRRLRCWAEDARGWRPVLLRAPGSGAAITACGPPRADAPYRLTRRELEVLTGLALAYTDQGLADLFTISLRTVHAHVDRVRTKLGVSSRTAAAARALTEGLVVLTVPLPTAELAAGLSALD